MNVLLVSTFSYGGAANACIRLHLGLLSIGVESRLLMLEKPKRDIPFCQNFEAHLAEKTFFHSLWQKGKEKHLSQLELRLIRNLPKAYFNSADSAFDITEHPFYKDADIVNLHWVARFLDYTSFFKKNRKPIIWTLHDMFPFSGGFHYRLDFPLEEYARPIQKNLAKKKKSLPDKGITVVSPSQWLLQESLERSIFGRYPHHKILYGIDTKVFKPYNKKLAKSFFEVTTNKKIILFVADHIENELKGIRYLLNAIELLPTDNVALCIIGNKANSQLVTGLKHDIYDLGRINDEKLMALAYSLADLFVIPSIQDNLPNTVIEALSCGVPTVGFPIGGIPDMIISGMNGLIAEEVCDRSLSETIANALSGLHKFNSNKIREDAISRFDLLVQANNYSRLYTEVARKAN